MQQASELERVTWELGLLKEMAELVSSSLDTTTVLQLAVERLGAAFGAEPVLIRLRTGAGLEARVVAAVGVSAESAERSDYEAAESWPAAAVLREGRAVRVDDIGDQPFTASEAYRAARWRSSVTVPISAGEDVLGALTVGSSEPGRFGSVEERMLTTIGRQIGVAVVNGRLFERVRRAKDEWQRTFDTITDPVALCDSQGRMVRVNAALAALCGTAPAKLIGRPCSATGLCDGLPECLVDQTLREQRRVSGEIVRPDGRIFAGTALPVSAGSREIVIVAHEVTEDHARADRLRELSQELQIANRELRSTVDRLRTTQEQVVQAGKLSALGQLVAGVAHELNNPLTSVMGYAQLVQQQVARQPDLAGTAKELVQDVTHILTEADRAARIVRNLLLFARRQAVARAHHDLAFLCDQVLELRAYDLRVKDIEISTSFASDLKPIFVDASQIQQALLNLVLNAEQALVQRPVRKLEVIATSEPGCGSLLLEVRDTGHGIERANLSRVFDPFFTTRGVGEGTGLGLSIVFGIVRDHGGEIWVESRRDQGTSFFVRLPTSDSARGMKGRALVASGDSGLRDFLVAAMSGWGFEVRPARNLREALESLAEDDPFLVIVDRAVIEPDPARWQDAWRRRDGQSVMIAAYSNAPDDATEHFLRDEARVVLHPSADLCQLHRAVIAACVPPRQSVAAVRRRAKSPARRRSTTH